MARNNDHALTGEEAVKLAEEHFSIKINNDHALTGEEAVKLAEEHFSIKIFEYFTQDEVLDDNELQMLKRTATRYAFKKYEECKREMLFSDPDQTIGRKLEKDLELAWEVVVNLNNDLKKEKLVTLEREMNKCLKIYSMEMNKTVRPNADYESDFYTKHMQAKRLSIRKFDLASSSYEKIIRQESEATFNRRIQAECQRFEKINDTNKRKLKMITQGQNNQLEAAQHTQTPLKRLREELYNILQTYKDELELITSSFGQDFELGHTQAYKTAEKRIVIALSSCEPLIQQKFMKMFHDLMRKEKDGYANTFKKRNELLATFNDKIQECTNRFIEGMLNSRCKLEVRQVEENIKFYFQEVCGGIEACVKEELEERLHEKIQEAKFENSDKVKYDGNDKQGNVFIDTSNSNNTLNSNNNNTINSNNNNTNSNNNTRNSNNNYSNSNNYNNTNSNNNTRNSNNNYSNSNNKNNTDSNNNTRNSNNNYTNSRNNNRNDGNGNADDLPPVIALTAGSAVAMASIPFAAAATASAPIVIAAGSMAVVAGGVGYLVGKLFNRRTR